MTPHARLTLTGLVEHFPNLDLREAVVRHPLVGVLGVDLVGDEVPDEEDAAGAEALGDPRHGQPRVLEVVQAPADGGHVKVEEGRPGQGRGPGVVDDGEVPDDGAHLVLAQTL